MSCRVGIDAVGSVGSRPSWAPREQDAAGPHRERGAHGAAEPATAEPRGGLVFAVDHSVLDMLDEGGVEPLDEAFPREVGPVSTLSVYA